MPSVCDPVAWCTCDVGSEGVVKGTFVYYFVWTCYPHRFSLSLHFYWFLIALSFCHFALVPPCGASRDTCLVCSGCTCGIGSARTTCPHETEKGGGNVMIITFPCPPFSVAGQPLGNDDERDLFPEALRLVNEIQPKAIMLANVR